MFYWLTGISLSIVLASWIGLRIYKTTGSTSLPLKIPLSVALFWLFWTAGLSALFGDYALPVPLLVLQMAVIVTVFYFSRNWLGKTIERLEAEPWFKRPKLNIGKMIGAVLGTVAGGVLGLLIGGVDIAPLGTALGIPSGVVITVGAMLGWLVGSMILKAHEKPQAGNKNSGSVLKEFLAVLLLAFGLFFFLEKYHSAEKPMSSDDPVSAEKPVVSRNETPRSARKTIHPGGEKKKPAVSRNETSPEKEPMPDEFLQAMINPDHEYTIETGSFSSRKTAGRVAGFYEDKGYPAFIRGCSPSGMLSFYCVRVGTFQSRERALEYGNEIKEKERDFKFYVTLND